MYSIYKTINKITGRFYIGKQHKNLNYYLGSGKLLQRAIEKHVSHNFRKVILEDGLTAKQACVREKYWIECTGALTSQGYNMSPGGIGGDNSKYIDYIKRGDNTDHFIGALKWRKLLTKKQKQQWYKKQGMARSKGWYVSRINSTKEIYVQNIAEWCRKKSIDTSMPTALTTPRSRLYLKQTKGWRIRRKDQPKLPPYENKQGSNQSDFCKGKTWRLVDGKRVWVSI